MLWDGIPLVEDLDVDVDVGFAVVVETGVEVGFVVDDCIALVVDSGVEV